MMHKAIQEDWISCEKIDVVMLNLKSLKEHQPSRNLVNTVFCFSAENMSGLFSRQEADYRKIRGQHLNITMRLDSV